MNYRFCLLLIFGVARTLSFETNLYNIEIKNIIKEGLRRFDGIGGLSGGGATSKLLVNYAEPYRSQILDLLFKPNYGASLHMLKVEIGGDTQSTEGTEASHMHASWDENYQRGYEWWLMREAKRRQPNILLYALPWGFPGWVGNGTRNPYTYPQLTVDYIVRWVNGAKTVHGLDIDYLGIWNEKPWDANYVKLLRQALDKFGFSKTRLVVGDGDWSGAPAVMNDKELSEAVDYLGAHYPGTISSVEAKQSGKQLWSSEDYSTMNNQANDAGAGCWARILNQNFVNGLMTSTIAWNLIASYYDGLPYPRCSLMTANEPWSGHYELPGPFWVTAHTTQFTQPGWRYLPINAGSQLLLGGGSMVSLTDGFGNLTIIFETMTHDRSQCIRPALDPYVVEPQIVTLRLGQPFLNVKAMKPWYSELGKNYFIAGQLLPVVNGFLNLTLQPNQLVTLTTLIMAGYKPSPSGIPPSQHFPRTYSDNFNDSQLYSEPFFLVPQVGSFEIQQSTLTPLGNTNQQINRYLVQTVLEPTLNWCPITLSTPYALLGSGNWLDGSVSLYVQLSCINGSDGVFLAARVDRGGCNAFAAQGLFLWIFDDHVEVTNDLMRIKKLTHIPRPTKCGVWTKLQIIISIGKAIFLVEDEPVFEFSNIKPDHGFVALGTNSFGVAYFDDLYVQFQ